MQPIGTRVTVISVEHLGKRRAPCHLVGRRGTVVDHQHGLNVVAGLTLFDRFTGLRVFSDTDLIPKPDLPRRSAWLPPFYRVRGYLVPESVTETSEPVA